MNNLVLIQARCGSTRLPNKVLKKIGPKTDLEWVIERVSKASEVDEVMVITSIEKNNLPLIKLCSELGIRVFVGSENDVLDRYYQAAKLLKPENVIRITADCPLIDWRYVDLAIDVMNNNPTLDYVGEFTDTFPDGLDVEVIKYQALVKSWRMATYSSEREHVTQYIRKHPELFNVYDLICPIENIGSKRWTLDEDEDFELINSIYSFFLDKGKEDFITEDILKYLKNNPQLELINAKYGRNEGLAKSIANDSKIEMDCEEV